MDLAALAGVAIRASIVLLVFSLGLRATHEDALYLLRRPGQLVRSLLSMNVIGLGVGHWLGGLARRTDGQGVNDA